MKFNNLFYLNLDGNNFEDSFMGLIVGLLEGLKNLSFLSL
jgi:hypothetical protein